MKKTIIALMALAGVAAADTVTTRVSFTEGENTYLAGSSYGDLTLSSNMETGSSENGVITFTPSVEILGNGTTSGSWYGVKNNTVSLWIETSSLSNDVLLFGYYSRSAGNSIGYYWDADTSTITFGRGTWNSSERSFTFSKSGSGHQESSQSLSTYFSAQDELTNFTISVERTDDYYANGTATIWVNGKNAGSTKAFYSDINGGNPTSYFVGGATYGTIAVTNENLTTAQQIANFAAPVPEPTTATLSLLALAGLAARRRRR